MKNKEANSNISNIEYDIHYVLENVAALGKEAHGAYNEKMQEFLVLSVKKVLMEERRKAQQEERLNTINSIISIFEQAPTQIDKSTALHVLTELK